VYVKLIGVESYGLVAFYGTLAGSLVLLDLGLSTSVSRQLARMRVDGSKIHSQADLLYSVEIIYWITALSAGLFVVLLAQPIAAFWVQSNTLSIPVIKKAVIIMGILIAFQFPTSVYNGALTGLEKQELYALINILFSTLKAIGVIIALKFVSATVETYFIWQVVVTLLFTLLFRYYAWHSLSAHKVRRTFSKKQLKSIWRFAAGMTGISLVTFFLTQVDKIVVSKYVTLDFVGYYNLAFMLAGSISQFISPFQPIVFPKFSQLIATGKSEELAELYHKSCRWVSVIVFPIGFGLIFFAKNILWLWTQNEILTLNTAPILQVFVIGTLCNSMLVIPYYYMLAKGITKFPLYQNTIAAIILTPTLFWLTSKYGAFGASFVWVTINASALIISIPLIHNLYFKGQLKKWYINDLITPLIYALSITLIAKYIINEFEIHITRVSLGITFIICVILYMILLPELRLLFAGVKQRSIKILTLQKGCQKIDDQY
jgi:O-antigen/teichoic acid export membrane protein